MMKFLAILFVFTLAHGVCFTAIMTPQGISWNMLRDVVFHPYYNIYGELFFEDNINATTTTLFGTEIREGYENTIGIILLAVYVLVANVLLLNLLIAIFGSAYSDASLRAQQIWGNQRYQLILEYTNRSVLVPPFVILSHIREALRALYNLRNKKGGKEDVVAEGDGDKSTNDFKGKSLKKKGTSEPVVAEGDGDKSTNDFKGKSSTRKGTSEEKCGIFKKKIGVVENRDIDAFESEMRRMAIHDARRVAKDQYELLNDMSTRMKEMDEQIKKLTKETKE